METRKRIPKEEVAPKDDRQLTHASYDAMLVEFVNQNLKEHEIPVYRAIHDSIKDKYKITEVNELILLDMVCYDFIRIKRLQKMITDEGDIYTVTTPTFSFKKVHEASYLLNAIESQIRNTMKELLITRKEQAKVAIGKNPKSFDEWLDENSIKVEADEVGDSVPKLQNKKHNKV